MPLTALFRHSNNILSIGITIVSRSSYLLASCYGHRFLGNQNFKYSAFMFVAHTQHALCFLITYYLGNSCVLVNYTCTNAYTTQKVNICLSLLLLVFLRNAVNNNNQHSTY